MRAITAGLFVSLDGVCESPGKWRLPFDAETAELIGGGVRESDAILLGRRTYLEFAEMWPNAGPDVPMAAYMNDTPKYVVSNTLDTLTWSNSMLIKGDVVARLTELKQGPGRNIQVPGSPRLVASLLRDGLLDELTLMIQPVLVGSGTRLFGELTDLLRLELLSSRVLGNGVVVASYGPAA